MKIKNAPIMKPISSGRLKEDDSRGEDFHLDITKKNEAACCPPAPKVTPNY